FIWSLTQYIAYYYLKKGEQVDTGDLFFNMTINFLIVLSTGSVLIWLIGKNIMDMIKYIRTSVDEIIKGKGDLTRRINIVSFDEMGLLTSDFNRLFLYLGNMIGNISEIAMKLENSKNILSVSIEKNKEIFESFIKSIGEIISGIENDFEQTNKLDEISTRIQESALSITDSVEKQQHAVQYSSSSTEEMGANIRSVTNIAKEANSNIFNLLAEIAQTKKDLNNSIKAINTINSSSANLLDYLKSISDISERVKLLAINASIEAARAGKSGEGFAVVAIEVRKLSESSSNSVKNIETKINEMNVVISTGTELINSTAKTLEVIFKKIEKTAQIIEEITTSMIEQTIGTQTIEKSVTDVLESASKLVNLAQNSKEESDNLKNISEYFISNSKKIYSLTGEQRDKNQNLIEVNQDLTNAALSINSSFAELEKILSEFKIK
ncbi:MAG TPA: HAMP domain-containing methyl-accepting chemotaxis protein, partial [Spirochaetota bacterium]|nr:HAMP domain-containing methyl-accepting chemotaxis protein [Spirochaetota bacterium]